MNLESLSIGEYTDYSVLPLAWSIEICFLLLLVLEKFISASQFVIYNVM